MKDQNLYLSHIIESAEAILSYTKGMTEKDFSTAYQTQDAVIRRFEIIGEATKHLTIDVRKKNTSIPWKKIAGMRDILIHEYFAVDIPYVWHVVKKQVPTLLKQVGKLIDA